MLTRLEAQIHKELPLHPNIVFLKEWFEDSMAVYLVLRRCLHGDLYDMIARPRSKNVGKGQATSQGLPTTVLKRYMLQIIDAVQTCHQNGVYHRDLKPENILLDGDLLEDGYPALALLGDFGLATKNNFSTELGLGTRAYLAPECLDEGIDGYLSAPSDVFALALVALQLVFPGIRLWNSTSYDDRDYQSFVEALRQSQFHDKGGLYQHRHGDHGVYSNRPICRWFTSRHPHISVGFQRILTKVLDPNPDRRISLLEFRKLIDRLDQFACVRTPSLLVTSLRPHHSPATRKAPAAPLEPPSPTYPREMVVALPNFGLRQMSSCSDISDMDFNDVMGTMTDSETQSPDMTDWEESFSSESIPPSQSRDTLGRVSVPTLIPNGAATPVAPSKGFVAEGKRPWDIKSHLTSLLQQEKEQSPAKSFENRSHHSIIKLSQIDWTELDDEDEFGGDGTNVCDWIMGTVPNSSTKSKSKAVEPTLESSATKPASNVTIPAPYCMIPKLRQVSIDSGIGASLLTTGRCTPIHWELDSDDVAFQLNQLKLKE
jgi:serine/threonine protein kinase